MNNWGHLTPGKASSSASSPAVYFLLCCSPDSHAAGQGELVPTTVRERSGWAEAASSPHLNQAAALWAQRLKRNKLSRLPSSPNSQDY